MEFYTTKNKQLDAIKHFFINKSKVLFIVLIIGIIIGIYWQSHQLDNLQESSKKFEDISSQLYIGSKQDIATAKKFAHETHNIYGIFMNIELAKIAIEKNDIYEAEKILIKALEKAKLGNLKDLLNIKLARVQLALNKLDLALSTLTQIKNKGCGSIIEHIRGDVLLKKGDIVNARAAYSKGIELSESGAEIMKTVLKIKVNRLPPI